jgi:hypothetical protein
MPSRALRPEQRMRRYDIDVSREAAPHDLRRNRLDRSDVEHERSRPKKGTNCAHRLFEAADRRRQDNDRAARRHCEAGEHDVGHLGEGAGRQGGIIGAEAEMRTKVLRHQASERAESYDADEWTRSANIV